ncbi:sugar kinase [uncultured Sphaerochaeta sp.]|uniref:sugar kinase n=1 Tax=uncultured Sphaerochaeta sp. TaxID=886478 RepID=UPI002AA92276|nr:sugar kinase [uncultured Sphaerochaeta sp.]
MGKIVCFGEIMLRLNPEGYLRIVQAQQFNISYAGAEANVAVSLANYGEDANFVSAVPDNLLGTSAIKSLEHWGVNTKFIKRKGERLGIYFIEKGASQRPSTVLYDRKSSSITTLRKDDINWDEIFKDTDWFHFTGITPALSENLVDITLEACKKAKALGIVVSCDLNYRKNLWSKEEAKKAMGTIVPYVDVLIANEEDSSDVFGIQAKQTEITKGEISIEGFKEVAIELQKTFGCKYIAITMRGSISATINTWTGILFDGSQFYSSPLYEIYMVDRVGGGDSFGGALIYALKNGYNGQEAIDFAVAASCLKQTIEYDFNHVTVEEVNKLMKGDGSGRVQR